VTHALLLVDVINDFRHEDGETLLASFRSRLPALQALVEDSRAAGTPLVYANDNWGVWDGDAKRLIREALERGAGGDVVGELAPRDGDRFVVKPRYSAFDSTPLDLVLRSLQVDRLVIAGAATEMCVFSTAIDGRRHGYDVHVASRACATVSAEHEQVALSYLADVLGIDVGAV
jgi:nicotinamidase-related amidase